MEKEKAEPVPEAENDNTPCPPAEEKEEEKIKVRLLRTVVENQDPSCKFGIMDQNNLVEMRTIRRFLRARDLDVDKAASMLLKYLKWRQTFVPNGQISPSDVPNEIAQNKMFAQGFDKQGRPISVTLGARHFINKKGGVHEFKRFIVFGLDKLCARTPAGQEKFVIIGDLQGWGYANIDIRAYMGALSI
ncbi:OLC1v1014428C1 [Oldenlandia corymbosa var. corymbosa]|uniref:OLC1v1014428C1 n=1 Tax=Oldenlandia corymbosa var. corymbosa TaxID=529605 RepID=A0AAV1E436_OLDCO|nr:OLC1v1014428C1 [Oldenlandia corymbosa var. corymbosa]